MNENNKSLIEEIGIYIVQQEKSEEKYRNNFKLVHEENSISPESIDSKRVESRTTLGYFCSNSMFLNLLECF